VQRSDITATANLSDVERGKNNVEINISVPRNVKVSRATPDTVTVTIEDRVSEQKTVRPEISTGKAGSSEAENVKASPSKVTVSGAKSAVRRVKAIKAQANVNGDSENFSITTNGIPVDRKGKKIGYLELSQSRIKLTGSVANTKKVNLNVKTKGTISSKYNVKSVDVPNSVVIKGSSKKLKDITEVSADDVDISGVTSSTKLPIDVKLPSGVKLADQSKDVSVDIVIEPLSSKKLQYSRSDIDIRDIGSGLSASLANTTVIVTVKGSSSVLKGISKADISLYVDLSGLKAGTRNVSIGNTHPNELDSVSIEPSSIAVTISEK